MIRTLSVLGPTWWQWGTVPDYLFGTLTLGALVIAWRQLQRGQRDAEERAESLVRTRLGGLSLHFEIVESESRGNTWAVRTWIVNETATELTSVCVSLLERSTTATPSTPYESLSPKTVAILRPSRTSSPEVDQDTSMLWTIPRKPTDQDAARALARIKLECVERIDFQDDGGTAWVKLGSQLDPANKKPHRGRQRSQPPPGASADGDAGQIAS